MTSLLSAFSSSAYRNRAIAIFAAGLLFALGYWLWQRHTHVYTDDARVAANMLSVSSKSAGRLTGFPLSSGDVLKKGQLVAQLDAREAGLRVRELEAQLNGMAASLARGEAEISKEKQTIEGQLQSAESALIAAQSNVASAQSDLTYKLSQWERAQSLRQQQIISRQSWEGSRTAWEQARQVAERAQAGVTSARAGLLEAEAKRAQLIVLEQQQRRMQFDREGIALALERARIDLADRTVEAPIDGVVDKTFVNSGEFVSPGQRLIMMHDPRHVWIDANIRETELRHLNIGNPVDIHVDAYPDMTFKGTVERIGNAATSQFALLPSSNPSGNFTKVTQRLPVRIAIEQKDGLLRPGMMVEVAIELD